MTGAAACSFADRVVVVVGGGRGLGRRYALDLGAAGARVVVAGPSATAQAVADEIAAAGGVAVVAIRDARDGDGIVGEALAAFGRIDALLINAGITRDRSFAKMARHEWDEVIDVHLHGAFACARAAWAPLRAGGGGAVLLTTSGAGMHGAFGQANYAAAKGGIIALARTLAIEGARDGIRVNALAPMASTAMTHDAFDDTLHQALQVEDVSPFALALLHPDCPATGQVIEAGGGWAAAMRWQRSAGLRLARPDVATILARWSDLGDFTDGADFPGSTADSLAAAADRRRAATVAPSIGP